MFENIEKTITSYENDKKKEEFTVNSKGEKHGLFEEWIYTNGGSLFLYSVGTYHNGKEHGLFLCDKKTSSGKWELSRERNFVDGEKHGSDHTWYANGQLRTKWEFIQGEIISMQKWTKDGKLEYENLDWQKHMEEVKKEIEPRSSIEKKTREYYDSLKKPIERWYHSTGLNGFKSILKDEFLLSYYQQKLRSYNEEFKTEFMKKRKDTRDKREFDRCNNVFLSESKTRSGGTYDDVTLGFKLNKKPNYGGLLILPEVSLENLVEIGIKKEKISKAKEILQTIHNGKYSKISIYEY